jgi:hypothetical protein
MDKKKDDDLREAMTEDISRGRRPIHAESKRSKKARIDQMRLMLTLATEEEFVKAMRDAGVVPGSPRFCRRLGFGAVTDLRDRTIERS